MTLGLHLYTSCIQTPTAGKYLSGSPFMCAKSPLLCLTLCDPMNYSLPGSSVHGIFQVKMLEGMPLPCPGDLPYPGIELGSPALQADSLPPELPGKSLTIFYMYSKACLLYAHFLLPNLPLLNVIVKIFSPFQANNIIPLH